MRNALISNITLNNKICIIFVNTQNIVLILLSVIVQGYMSWSIPQYIWSSQTLLLSFTTSSSSLHLFVQTELFDIHVWMQNYMTWVWIFIFDFFMEGRLGGLGGGGVQDIFGITFVCMWGRIPILKNKGQRRGKILLIC